MGAAPDYLLHHLRALCTETQSNLDYVRGAGYAGGRAPLRQCAPDNASSPLAKLSADVARLQQAQDRLAASLQGSGDSTAVRRLEQRLDGLGARLAAALEGPRLQGPAAPASVGEELGRCLDRVAALQQEHAAFAGSVQQQLASLRTAPAVAGGEAERLQRALAASEHRATEDRSLTAAALERLAQQADAFSARLDQLAAAPPEPGGAQEAMQQVEARLEEVAAVQERQAAELLELRQAPGSCAQTESAGRTGQQLQALEDRLEALGQTLFDLRVEVQNGAEDATIVQASTKRQAEEALQQAEAAASEATSATDRVQALEKQLGALHEQVEALQRAADMLSSSHSANRDITSFAPLDELTALARAVAQQAEALEALQAQQAATTAGVAKSLEEQAPRLAELEGAVHRFGAGAQQHAMELAEVRHAVVTAEQRATEALEAAHSLQQHKEEAAMLQKRVSELEAAVRPLTSLAASVAGLEAAVAAADSAREQLAGQLACVQRQLAEAQGAAVAAQQQQDKQEERVLPAAITVQLRELGARVSALGDAASRQELASQQRLRELQRGLDACVAGCAQVEQRLEGRVGRTEAVVAGALDEVSGQMVSLEAHVAQLERGMSASAQQAATVATLSTLAHVQQLVTEASQHSSSGGCGVEPGVGAAGGSRPARRSSSLEGSEYEAGGRQQRWRRHSSTAGLEASTSPAEGPRQQGRPAAAAGLESVPASLRQERSLREQFGAAASFSRRRNTSQGADEQDRTELATQAALLERALEGSDVDEVQREILTSDLEHLRSQLAGR